MRSRWSIIWAAVLILGGAFLLAQNLGVLGELDAPLWSVLLVALGALFLLNFITDPAQWWSLIPGCILLGMGLVVYLGVRGDVAGELMGSLVLFSVGLPFLLIFVLQYARGQKEFWWALIPGGILVFVGLAVLLTARLPGEAIASVIMLGIALPFWGIFLANRRENWWALIPGGILLVVGAVPLVTLATQSPNVIGGAFFLGLAAVFGLMYVLNLGGQGSQWTAYPALGLLAIGISVAAFGQYWWPVILILGGVLLLVRALRPGG